MKVLLTHTPQSRAQYYGARALAGLRAIADVKLHDADDALDARPDRGRSAMSTSLWPIA